MAFELIWLSHYLLVRGATGSVGLRYSGSLWPGRLRGKRLNGFRRIPIVRQFWQPPTILHIIYILAYTGRKAIRPGFHKPESYFYPYGGAKPTSAWHRQLKKNLTGFDLGYLMIGPDSWFHGAVRTGKLILELLQLYPRQPDLLFVSQDSFHRYTHYHKLELSRWMKLLSKY
jgi:hypothetical protein